MYRKKVFFCLVVRGVYPPYPLSGPTTKKTLFILCVSSISDPAQTYIGEKIYVIYSLPLFLSKIKFFSVYILHHSDVLFRKKTATFWGGHARVRAAAKKSSSKALNPPPHRA